MEKEIPKIQVIDVDSAQILFECSLDESDRAYKYAAQMEELGLDIIVKSPTLTETLTNSLGLTAQEKETYFQSMNEEIEQHEGSCCFEDQNK